MDSKTLFNTIKNNKLPNDFNINYQTYINNILLWILPLDTNDKITSKTPSLLIFSYINEIIKNKDNINDTIKSYYHNLLFASLDNNQITLDYLFNTYGLYYDSYSNQIKDNKLSIDKVSFVIKIIMQLILTNEEMINTNNNLITSYYTNIFSQLIPKVSLLELLISKDIIPNYHSNLKNIFSDVFKANVSLITSSNNDSLNNSSNGLLNQLHNLNFIITNSFIDLLNTKSIDNIINSINSLNINLMFKYSNDLNYVVNNLKMIKCNYINNKTKLEVKDMDLITNYIKDKKLKITKEDYLAFNDNQKNNYLSLIILLFNLEH